MRRGRCSPREEVTNIVVVELDLVCNVEESGRHGVRGVFDGGDGWDIERDDAYIYASECDEQPTNEDACIRG